MVKDGEQGFSAVLELYTLLHLPKAVNTESVRTIWKCQMKGEEAEGGRMGWRLYLTSRMLENSCSVWELLRSLESHRRGVMCFWRRCLSYRIPRLGQARASVVLRLTESL